MHHKLNTDSNKRLNETKIRTKSEIRAEKRGPAMALLYLDDMMEYPCGLFLIRLEIHISYLHHLNIYK